MALARTATFGANAAFAPPSGSSITRSMNELAAQAPPVVLRHKGRCPICGPDRVFESRYSWLRDHFICNNCGSIPRERALMRVIDDFRPDWRAEAVHESSPGGRGVSVKLGEECPGYSYSHFFDDVPLGETHPIRNERCENLEALTFADASFDLFVTQDVMEHVFDPAAAFREIARVLKPGGAHIFTAPLVNKGRPSAPRAIRRADGSIDHLREPEYHGNPVDPEGSLVTMDWGYDIAAVIQELCGCPSVIVQIDDLDQGIRAEYIDVIVTFKR